jgi:hypothetical protein
MVQHNTFYILEFFSKNYMAYIKERREYLLMQQHLHHFLPVVQKNHVRIMQHLQFVHVTQKSKYASCPIERIKIFEENRSPLILLYNMKKQQMQQHGISTSHATQI